MQVGKAFQMYKRLISDQFHFRSSITKQNLFMHRLMKYWVLSSATEIIWLQCFRPILKNIKIIETLVNSSNF